MNTRRFVVILHDLAMTPLALAVAYYLRSGGQDFAAITVDLPVILAVFVPVAGVTYWFFGLYQGVWRFASTPDLVNIARAATALALALATFDFLSGGRLLVPRTIPPIYWLVQILLLAGPRFAYRMVRDRRVRRRAATQTYRMPVLIAGAGLEAERRIRSFETRAAEPMIAVGLLGKKRGHVGERIRTVPILGQYSDLERVVAALKHDGIAPKRLIFTRDALLEGTLRDDLIAAARELGLAVLRPQGGLEDLSAASGRKLSLAPIAIEDLLGRNAHDLDLKPIAALLRGRRVLVTGAGGSIGSELCRQIAGMDPDLLVLADNSEQALYHITQEVRGAQASVRIAPRLCDVRDRAAVGRLFRAFKPELVFNTAALKHVDMVETHPDEAVRTNVVGARNVADAAQDNDALALVYISTDKAVSPVSVLGASKKAGEIYCRLLDAESDAKGRPTRFLTVRFGNVLGSSGSVVPLFKEQLARGGPITVTHPEVERFFMTTSEAVTLVLMATALGVDPALPRRSIYILDMGRPVRIVDLAIQMIRLAGLEPGRDVPIVFTGLRPGERLSEELSSAGEALSSTPVEGVLAADSPRIDPARVRRCLGALEAAADAGDEHGVRSALSELVDDYAWRTGPAVVALR